MSFSDVLNGVAAVLCIVGFVLDCAERIASWLKCENDRH